mmetsp:Transcript_6120/g.15799  ORF Transcript_6120/g.15799 Transcript_6120/m.15799 type:complete len:316 (-) Transcript_6120:339-1286(-)
MTTAMPVTEHSRYPRASSVLVVLYVQRLAGGLHGRLAEGGKPVGLGALEECRLRGPDVLGLAAPGLEHACLQRAAKGEGQHPGAPFQLVDLVQVRGRLLLALAAAEEHYARNGGRHRAAQRLHRQRGRVARVHLGGLRARQDHVGLKQRALQQHVVVVEGLVAGGDDALRDGGTHVNAVRPVGQDLRLHDRHQPVLLADRCVARQANRVLVDRQLTRFIRPDLEHRAPLGKARASLVVLGASVAEAVQTRGLRLAVGAGQLDHALVDLDPRDDAALLQQLHHRGAVGSLLEQSLLEQDDAAYVLLEVGSREEQLA